jgi:hypothetical protein
MSSTLGTAASPAQGSPHAPGTRWLAWVLAAAYACAVGVLVTGPFHLLAAHGLYLASLAASLIATVGLALIASRSTAALRLLRWAVLLTVVHASLFALAALA